MAKALKYQFTFPGRTSGTFKCEFWVEGFTGDPTTLQTTARPFVLSEFNTSEDLFKPVRPFQATIEIIGSSDGVTIDDFIMDNDDDIEVRFYYNSTNYFWRGFIIQDNFQEVWQDTYHVITLTATEGLGQLTNVQFGNAGAEVLGRIQPLEAIEYCLQNTVIPLVPYTAFNNLFHDSMTDTSTNFPLDQCYIDSRTFQVEAREFDNKYDALSKINTSFSQTIFQYKGEWFIHRIEEWYTPLTDNLRGFRDNGARTALNKRYDVNVGVNEYIKPIMPEMLRYILRRTKQDQVVYNYTPFNEVIENESFTRGTILSQNPSTTLRTLDSWTYETGSFASPTTPSGDYGLIEEYVDGTLDDTYAFFDIPATTGAFWIKSEQAQVLSLQKLDINFECQYNPNLSNFPTGKVNTKPCWVFLDGVTNNYQLLNTGKWEQIATSYPTKAIELAYDSNKEPRAIDWNSVSVQSDTIPENGSITIFFYAGAQTGMTGNEFRIKNFKCQVLPSFQSDTQSGRKITGVQSYFEKADNLRNSSTFEIYFDDGFSKSHKGALYEDDENTLTDTSWYRYRFPTELENFKREALIAKWQFNRFNRNKLDVTFYNIFDDTTPIGLMNTIKFVDDDPNKVYAILNMKEIDFNANTWTATLVEVYDEDKDGVGDPITETFEADVTDGTYSGITYVPFTITSAADVTISPSNIFTFNANDSVEVDFLCSVGGYINSAASVPSTVYLYLQKNGSTIATASINVNSTPEPFNVSLNVNDIQLDYLDTFNVLIDSNIYEIQLSTGTIGFSYTSAVPFVYDTFTTKYISN